MMKFSVVGSVRHLTAQYRQFIRSTYRLADEQLRGQFEHQIENAEALVKGPYVTLARDFEQGETLARLVAQGCGHSDLKKLKWPFGDNPLYRHQEESLCRVTQAGRNIVVKTGTGSGKTEAFLLPVLSGVLQLREEGVSGTKAILLYPMNALANDQLVRLREMIRNRGLALTFALYTGDSEQTSRTLGEPVEGCELIDRRQIQANPPDILLTNFKQLEYLLIRKADRPLFTSALRFLVLDEIHTYRGALATEIACLIKRLKARCGLDGAQLRCLGTSATVSQDAGGDESLARFASDLFSETFAPADIIGEQYQQEPESPGAYDPPFPVFSDENLAAIDYDHPESVLAAAERLAGRTAKPDGSVAERIAHLLNGSRVVQFLQLETREPYSLNELAEKLAQALPASAVLSSSDRERLLQAYLAVGSFGAQAGDGGKPLIRPKLHTFFQGVYDVGLCINPDCRTLISNGADKCPKCGSLVFPAVLCRTCGQDFFKARVLPGNPERILPNDDFSSDDDTAFITPKLVVEGDQDDDEAARPRRRGDMETVHICNQTGKVYDRRPADAGDSVHSYLMLRGKGSTCPACNQSYTRGDILTLLRTGAASSTSVLATHHLDKLPDEDRRLLVFADNRQEAAHQAGYTGDKQRDFAVRHALERIVKDAGEKGVALSRVEWKMLELWQSMGLIPQRMGRDEADNWRLALSYESASEFCRSTHQRVSLENLALVAVEYDLDRIQADPRFGKACECAGVKEEDGIVVVRAMLDHMRRSRAVGFPFYQKFLNPEKSPWNELSKDCGVGFPEHEGMASFFVLERPEAARAGAPGGCKFNPLLKDTARGNLSAIPKLTRIRAGMGDKADEWVKTMVQLLEEEGIIKAYEHLPPRARDALGGGRKAWQIEPSRIYLVPAKTGHRCCRCQTWRPYRGLVCYGANRCPGKQSDLREAGANLNGYYEQLYTLDVPRRLVAREHTAQIADNDRAIREKDFKAGKIDVLVCSPTLELGVDIGQLHSVLMRNSPPTPANYVQRAGRAGRAHRIGFVSTFSGVGSHDRHCFDDPSWLVRGQYRPPTVRMDNSMIVGRHVRSYILEELESALPSMMSEFIDDVHHPETLVREKLDSLSAELETRRDELSRKAARVFDLDDVQAVGLVAGMGAEFSRVLEVWHAMVLRLHQEFEEFRVILSPLHDRQKAAARERAYRELTTDQAKAYALSYFANAGLLPSYQFPMDTFMLDPGVGDVPTLRRPSWIALFEFAPGNLVYANGHKLKSIRAFFEGRSTSAGMEGSGRTRAFSFCTACGWAKDDIANACPRCGTVPQVKDVALLESFEAEENTQITSAEEARQRINFTRHESLLPSGQQSALLYKYPFAFLEYRKAGRILLSNWGKKSGRAAEGGGFNLCQHCGKHMPEGLTPAKAAKWESVHAQRCKGQLHNYVLGYEFSADTLIFPVPANMIPESEQAAGFLRTLGTAMIRGAVELLEIEEDEIASFYNTHPQFTQLVFYETVPGGAGYLQALAKDVPRWATEAAKRLYNHECSGACYRCLKSYRNQWFHRVLDKNLVRDALFQLQNGGMIEAPQRIKSEQAPDILQQWLDQSGVPTRDTPIEKALLNAMQAGRRLPEPVAQYELRRADGSLITVPDFVFPDKKIAIYCDGYAYHGDRETLEKDAAKRNEIQAMGWKVVVFWGRTILNSPEACETQIWRIYLGA
jgi:very-short-patch-repair endonuclease